ncbi:nuclear transport factor 2 family protein [Streptomyces sp. NPDC001414]
MHSFTNPIIDVDGDTASGNWLLWDAAANGGRPHEVHQSEDLRYVRTPDGWRVQALIQATCPSGQPRQCGPAARATAMSRTRRRPRFPLVLDKLGEPVRGAIRPWAPALSWLGAVILNEPYRADQQHCGAYELRQGRPAAGHLVIHPAHELDDRQVGDHKSAQP